MAKKKGGYKNIDPEKGVKFEEGNNAAEKWTEEKALELGEELLSWIKTGGKENMFFNWFLKVEKGLYTDLTAYLSKKFPFFNDILEEAKEIQQIKLIKYGVDDKLSAQMTKFVLMNHHGMSEKVENDNRSSILKMTPEELEKRKSDLLKKLKSD